jgi:hypothetical protein
MIFYNTPPPPPPVTIFVHGTRPSAVLPCDPFSLVAMGEQMFYAYPPGLCHINTIESDSYAHVMVQELVAMDATQFCTEQFYCFGWSGVLSHDERCAAAEELYQSITDLCIHYQKIYNQLPRITIITHSHGGNVALLLGDCAQKTPALWTIARLVFLACPVQTNTMDLIAAPLFEKIYSLHSHDDILQVLDPQAMYDLKSCTLFEKFKKIVKKIKNHKFFSERHFPPHPKLVQSCLTWKKGVRYQTENVHQPHIQHIYHMLAHLDRLKRVRGLWHIEFQLKPFMHELPKILTLLDAQTEAEVVQHAAVVYTNNVISLAL